MVANFFVEEINTNVTKNKKKGKKMTMIGRFVNKGIVNSKTARDKVIYQQMVASRYFMSENPNSFAKNLNLFAKNLFYGLLQKVADLVNK